MLNIKFLNKYWNIIAALATCLLHIIGTFLIPPPTGTSQSPEDSLIWHFGRFILIIFLGLLFIPLAKYNKRKQVKYWISLSVSLFLFCFFGYWFYLHFTDKWTCKYVDDLVVIGSELTPHGKEYVNNIGSFNTCSEKILDHAGDIEALWTKESIDYRRRWLAFFYLIALLLFSSTIICMIQSLYCSLQQSRKSRAINPTN